MIWWSISVHVAIYGESSLDVDSDFRVFSSQVGASDMLNPVMMDDSF